MGVPVWNIQPELVRKHFLRTSGRKRDNGRRQYAGTFYAALLFLLDPDRSVWALRCGPGRIEAISVSGVFESCASSMREVHRSEWVGAENIHHMARYTSRPAKIVQLTLVRRRKSRLSE
jgi:hypothetical protein